MFRIVQTNPHSEPKPLFNPRVSVKRVASAVSPFPIFSPLAKPTDGHPVVGCRNTGIRDAPVILYMDWRGCSCAQKTRASHSQNILIMLLDVARIKSYGAAKFDSWVGGKGITGLNLQTRLRGMTLYTWMAHVAGATNVNAFCSFRQSYNFDNPSSPKITRARNHGFVGMWNL